VVTLSDLQSHSPIANHFRCGFLYSCVANDKISTDSTHSPVPRRWLSLSLLCVLCAGTVSVRSASVYWLTFSWLSRVIDVHRRSFDKNGPSSYSCCQSPDVSSRSTSRDPLILNTCSQLTLTDFNWIRCSFTAFVPQPASILRLTSAYLVVLVTVVLILYLQCLRYRSPPM